MDVFDATPKVKRANRLPENPQKDEKMGRFPKWLHRPLPKGDNLFETNEILKTHALSTVCEEAKCPNRFECYSKHTATFLVLGSACTRQCGFCDIDFSKKPVKPDPKEPENIAKCVKDLKLNHIVITMVARDDMEDGGANHLVKIIQALKKEVPQATLEFLTSDFDGKFDSIDIFLNEPIEILNHNIETVRRLTPRVRNRAEYDRTLSVLKYFKDKSNSLIKSGIMVGFGESEGEVFETIEDLKNVGCDIITIGQYLQASRDRANVKEFVTPQQFKKYEDYGKKIGVKHMYCGPFVRSSYNAEKLLKMING